MKYALLVMGAPYSSQAPHSALRFARALLDGEHTLDSVFFYRDGVHNASFLMTPPQDEANLHELWCGLNRDHGVKLDVCIAAALRRGLINAEEAARHGHGEYSVAPPFQLTGLGQLLDIQQRCDRVITFAA